ncbi:protein of unknown function (plasmid) [Cupriavidus taiwanensis]|uniref:Uncharacterized protein n=1 Tax=Cupriavidus taiwanensis TaxID=164546 RepID=A0A7Z7JG31_9BURK|nr:hypothetical protein CBM2597_U30053 [Cupriavidus taiwanensis]SOZ96997.1 hypothetical protein CBM2598_U30056 [Cupriavidus taiwanensis]SPC25927.1 hypothetical protein CBM2594_U20114 [Cupriavidus taiwanensis]SPD38047.1 protein of unknown function [Cupriavidus taiwanensis]
MGTCRRRCCVGASLCPSCSRRSWTSARLAFLEGASRRIHASRRPTEALPQHVGSTADLTEQRGALADLAHALAAGPATGLRLLDRDT